MTELNPEAAPEVVKDDVISAPTPATMIRRPVAPTPPADVQVEEPATPEPEVVVEPEPEPEPEVVEESKPEPKKPASKKESTTTALPAIELLAAAFVESGTRKNSSTVTWAQNRLAELGYDDARADLSGWYSSGTAAAVAAFQKDRGLRSHDARATLEALVAGTGASVI